MEICSIIVGLSEVVLVFVDAYSALSFRWRESCNGWLDKLPLSLPLYCGGVC